MDINKKIELVKQVGEEIISIEDLQEILNRKSIVAYDGFEPSGTDIHIAQGLLRAININKMTKAGCKFKMLVADWHAWANNKMEGNLEHIQKVGKYLIEVWRACDMDLSKVEFIWASSLVKDDNYWKLVMQIARNSTLKRIIRCSQIMGRKEDEALQASQILYPCMQAADIFYLKADITQLGMDQRKVNMLARELGPKLGYYKPIVVSHHMLMGLGEPPKGESTDRVLELKMSKSKPDTAIFMSDSAEVIEKKIRKAYCPEGVVNENPILEYCRYIIFERINEFKIERPAKWGGDLSFKDYSSLEEAFSKKEVHPADLKKCVSKYLYKLLSPVQKKLSKHSKLVEEIKGFKVTR